MCKRWKNIIEYAWSNVRRLHVYSSKSKLVRGASKKKTEGAIVGMRFAHIVSFSNLNLDVSNLFDFRTLITKSKRLVKLDLVKLSATQQLLQIVADSNTHITELNLRYAIIYCSAYI